MITTILLMVAVWFVCMTGGACTSVGDETSDKRLIWAGLALLNAAIWIAFYAGTVAK